MSLGLLPVSKRRAAMSPYPIVHRPLIRMYSSPVCVWALIDLLLSTLSLLQLPGASGCACDACRRQSRQLMRSLRCLI